MNKRFFYILTASGVVLFSLFLIFHYKNLRLSGNNDGAPELRIENTVKKTSLTIDYGDGNKQTFQNEVEGNSVFDLLKNTATDNNIKLDIKSYDFGIFVKSIGGLENGPDKAWVYYVNGESGQVAADKYVIEPGDRVEWKYVTPLE